MLTLTSLSAPLSTRYLTISVRPWWQATCREVLPALLWLIYEWRKKNIKLALVIVYHSCLRIHSPFVTWLNQYADYVTLSGFASRISRTSCRFPFDEAFTNLSPGSLPLFIVASTNIILRRSCSSVSLSASENKSERKSSSETSYKVVKPKA